MQKLGALKKLAAIATLVSVSVLGSLAIGIKPTQAAPRYIEPWETEQTSFIKYDRVSYEVASYSTLCRQVDTNGGRLHIRQVPGGRIIGYLYEGERVSIVSGSSRNGWVRLADGGYVSSSYLKSCARSRRSYPYYGR